MSIDKPMISELEDMKKLLLQEDVSQNNLAII